VAAPSFQTFLVAQTVKNLPAAWETWVQSLGWEDPLEESMATQIWVIYTYYLTIPVLHQEPQLIVHSMRIIPCAKAK